jgi:hypothetical protein
MTHGPPALPPATAAADPIRAVTYIRVSKARDGMISPKLQRRAMDEHCR